MQQENDEDVDRRPRQIEHGVDAGAGDELAEVVEIAQHLARRRGPLMAPSMVAASTRPASSRSRRTLARVRMRARTTSSPASATNASQQHEREHHKRGVARARDHAVVDLQHVERGGEIEQINGEAEDERRGEIAPAGLENGL